MVEDTKTTQDKADLLQKQLRESEDNTCPKCRSQNVIHYGKRKTRTCKSNDLVCM